MEATSAPAARGSAIAVRLIPILLSISFALLCATSLTRKSGTYDEYLVGIGTRLSAPEAIFHPPLSSVVHRDGSRRRSSCWRPRGTWIRYRSRSRRSLAA